MVNRSFRFTDEMVRDLSAISNWVNQSNDNLNYNMTDKQLLALSLQLVNDLFVKPYNENPKNDFVALQKKYARAFNGMSEMDIRKQLQNIQGLLLSIKLLELNLAKPLDASELENYLQPGTHAHEIDAAINILINDSVSQVTSQTND